MLLGLGFEHLGRGHSPCLGLGDLEPDALLTLCLSFPHSLSYPLAGLKELMMRLMEIVTENVGLCHHWWQL